MIMKLKKNYIGESCYAHSIECNNPDVHGEMNSPFK
jgi:hypothetical protein